MTDTASTLTAPGPLDTEFPSTLQKSPAKGGWTYVQRAIGKRAGDTVTVRLEERMA